MKAGIVQRIFNDHFAAYRLKKPLHLRETNAARAIMTCRSEEQGYRIDVCPNGDYQTMVFNSCRHRACPQCGAAATQLWLERRRAQALDCPYFHIVITIDHGLHIIWRYNRRLFTNLMMRAGWHCLRELLLDWRHLGGLVGAIAAFQSWDDEMRDHCHLHFIVTAGGLNPDGRWVRADEDFLLPAAVLADKFRGKFLSYLRKGFSRDSAPGRLKPEDQVLKVPAAMRKQRCLNLLNKVGRKRFHVNIDKAYEYAGGVIKYVGRYVNRGPISEKRIIGYDGNLITIAYAHKKKHDSASFTVSAQQFIERLLSHVPAKGTHVVRTYGLFHPNCQDKLNMARMRLGQPKYVPLLPVPRTIELLRRMFPDQIIGRCPHCGTELRAVFINRGGQAQRFKLAA